MANPATKNGFFPIANELAEKLALINIPGNEMRIIWVLWRKTWGWASGNRKKDSDWISYTQFEELTGIKRRNCIDCIKSLIKKKIVIENHNHYKFNQNYEEWVVSKRTPSVQKQTGGSVQKDTKGSVQKQTHKRNKEIIKQTGVFSKKMKNYKEPEIDYETGEPIPEKPKSNKRVEMIALANLFDRMASHYSGKKIETPNGYHIVFRAMSKPNNLKDMGVRKLYEDWFNREDIEMENKIKMSWCLGPANITSFKFKN